MRIENGRDAALKTAVGDAFDTIEGLTVRGRRLQVVRLQDLGETSCDILFISESERRRLDELLSSLTGQPVLTVSEVAGFAGRGGMVNFVLERKKVRFEIDVDAVDRAGLEVSAKLLRVARVVRDGGR